MNFVDPEGQSDVSWTYYTCSTGLQVTETIPFGIATRCLANSNQTASGGIVTGGTVVCSGGGTTNLIASASASPLIDPENLLGEYTLSDNPGCWVYYSSSIETTASPQTVTGTCGLIPEPTIEEISLGFNSYSSNNACNSSGTTVYYADSDQLNLATTIYEDEDGEFTAGQGYYSNGVIVRYMINGVLGAIASCTGGTGLGDTNLEGINDVDSDGNNDVDPYLGEPDPNP
tara:strand:- start:268 stop:957 length:690 start_codon:yes stop_codon:yes gene_type:complete